MSNWCSNRIDCADVDWADIILLSDHDNLARLREDFPEAIHKTTMLGLFSSTPHTSIADPFTLDMKNAEIAAREVMRAVDGFLARLNRERA